MGLPIGIKNTLSLRSKGVFYCPMGKPIGIKPASPTVMKGGGTRLLVESMTITQEV